MAPRALSRYDLMTWGFAAAALLLILHLELLPALIAGLLVYVLVNLLTPLLRNRMLWGEGPRLLAVSLIAATVITGIGLLGVAAASLLRDSHDNIPALITRMAEIIEQSRDQLPRWLLEYIPADTEELRIALYEKLEALAPAYLIERRSGDLVSLATQDVETVEYFFAHTVAPAIVAIVIPLGVLAWLVHASWGMAAALLVPCVTTVSIMRSMSAAVASETTRCGSEAGSQRFSAPSPSTVASISRAGSMTPPLAIAWYI
jgi:ABC-type multidrug transport system fused ATPase/permease subunit